MVDGWLDVQVDNEWMGGGWMDRWVKMPRDKGVISFQDMCD